MADDLVLSPRPLLARSIDTWTDGLMEIIGRRDPVESVSKMLVAQGRETDFYQQMKLEEGVLSAAIAARNARASSHGASFVAGMGPRAELYRRVAQGIWDVPYREIVEAEIIANWWAGHAIHEAVNVRAFKVDGKVCLGPAMLIARAIERYHFTVDRDLVFMGDPSFPRGRRFFTASIPGHPHRLKYFPSLAGSTRSPYGSAVADDAWVTWKVLGDLTRGHFVGLHTSNGILSVKESGVVTSNITSDATFLAAREFARKANSKRGRGDGLLFQTGQFESEILDYGAAGTAWLEPARDARDLLRQLILGADLAQASKAVGTQALGTVHEHAADHAGKTDVTTASANIDPYVHGWLRANFPGVEIDPEELPTWTSNMLRQSSLEDVQAVAAAGGKVDRREVARRRNVPLADPDDPNAEIWEVPVPVVVAPTPPGEDPEDEDADDEIDEETKNEE